ncbi:MAG: pyridoxamine 5'-phosphate oxidase family protein [Nocardioides sp.]
MAHLTDLTDAEIWTQLESGALARIAWTASSGPQILPVNFVTHDGAVWLRTTAHSSMADQIDESPVAIEIDDIDPATHVGWSIVVHGRAEAIYHESDVPEEVTSLRAWAGDHRPLWIRVSADTVTGKRLSSQ